MHDQQRPASARAAIELLTAWLDCPVGRPDFLFDRLLDHLNNCNEPEDRLARAVELIMGLVYLSGSTLYLRQYDTGTDVRETLRQLALEYAQD